MPVGNIPLGRPVPIVVATGNRGNWFSGTATSGATGEDLFLIGNDGEANWLLSLIVDLSALTPAATATIRLYQEVNGTERLVQVETFTVGTAPDGAQVISAARGIHEQVRAEMQSSGPDDGAWADREFMLLPM